MSTLALTVKQAAEETGFPVSTIYSLISRGILAEVRFPNVGGRRVWVLRADLMKLIEKARVVRS